MGIRTIRERVNMRQADVASALCVDISAVSKWEAGANKPTADNLIKLSKLFKCSIDALLEDEVKPNAMGNS